ncbi:cholesterol 7-desaturase nvd [Plodia interpunctella]|uniref:cholesterol 7-desaturase nvd n=1 Tax=Plodia interpunctella TaxID=58824 RepID=UPI0023685F04|nr:cholesterol 7-desaturase nvd [Plodia interpunctella]XP_053622398.1 cholesterol 7-desaturase nvd [Plodia interpunctella]
MQSYSSSFLTEVPTEVCNENVSPSWKFSECQSAILKSENSDIILFYFNLTFSVVRFVKNLMSDNLGVILTTVILMLVIYYVCKSFWCPIVYTKELTDIGFEHIAPGPDREAKISRAQNARRLGSKIPPPYPNGWFALYESRDLKVGDVVPIDALGQNLCIYRGEDGVARCVDAYCPHLGANLGVGGAVRGNCIECPFHKWTFGADGACASVPGVEHAPRGVSIGTWRTVEADGAVWVWHDAERRAPLWGLEDAPELDAWGYRGRNEFLVSAHIQEIPENGADVAHLNAVHSPSLLSSLGERYPVLQDIIGRHVWAADWQRNDDHTATMTLTHDYKILKSDWFHIDVEVTQIGPGHVRLRLATPIGPVLVSQSVTPVGPLTQRVIHRFFSPPHIAPLAPTLVKSEAYMFERDVVIWNSKRFVSAPAYVKTDKTIRAFRSWYSQFYSENSLSFRDAIQNPLDW